MAEEATEAVRCERRNIGEDGVCSYCWNQVPVQETRRKSVLSSDDPVLRYPQVIHPDSRRGRLCGLALCYSITEGLYSLSLRASFFCFPSPHAYIQTTATRHPKGPSSAYSMCKPVGQSNARSQLWNAALHCFARRCNGGRGFLRVWSGLTIAAAALQRRLFPSWPRRMGWFCNMRMLRGNCILLRTRQRIHL